jgi:SagB-type dehydrogenase family enzyme
MVASARCLFGVQLYVCLADGAYHYDAPHHALVLLREGDHRTLLTRATGTAGPVPEAVLVLSGLFSKTAYIYRDYAYRLCTQEAGLLAGNLDLVAGAMGLRARMHHQFLDEPVDRLLGLDGAEEPALLVLPLHLATAAADARPTGGHVRETAAALAASIEAIAPRTVPSGLRVARSCPTLTEVDRASLRTDTGTFATAEPAVPADGGAEPRPLPATDLAEPDLAQLLRARDSGPGIFRPLASAVDGVELWARLATIRAGVAGDSVPAGSPAPLEVFLTVGDLTGVPAGAYRLDAESGALHPVPRPDAAADADPPDAVTTIERATIPGPVFTHVNAIVHLVADRDWAFDTFGDRGYRVINQEAGVLAHRVCVAAAAQGMSARVVNAYQAEGVRAALGLTGQRHTPVFQILLARTGPGGRMIVPVEPEAVE